MKLQHRDTKDVLELPPPDQTGRSVVRFNGKIVEKVTYRDIGEGTVTTDDGRIFNSDQWKDYLIEQMRVGGWSVIN